MTDLEVRSAVQADVPYIIATWLNHYKEHSYFALRIKRGIFFRSHHRVVCNILSRHGTRAYVIHPKGEPEIIFGFLVIETQPDQQAVIHFPFVQEKLRRKGLCRALMKEAGFDWEHAHFTHWTYTASDLVRRFPGLTYDPYRS